MISQRARGGEFWQADFWNIEIFVEYCFENNFIAIIIIILKFFQHNSIPVY